MDAKVVIITGAAEGIGAAMAEKLSEMGMKVALLDICSELLEKTVSSLKDKGRAVHGITCDVTNKEQVFDAVDQVLKKWSKIDICIANAGICYPSLVNKVEVDKWLQVVDVNCIGILNCVAAVLPNMMSNKAGHIVFTSSVAGRQGIQFFSHYCGSKHFVQGYAASIRQELAPLGIKVTCIQPGFVHTRIIEKGVDPEIFQIWGPSLSLSPMLKPRDIADAVAFCVTREDRVGVNEIMLESSERPMNHV